MKKCCQVATIKQIAQYKKWGIRFVYGTVSLILIILAIKQVLNF
jgi:hypothetical protein